MTLQTMKTSPAALIAPANAVDLLNSLANASPIAPGCLESVSSVTDHVSHTCDRFHITDRSGLEWYSRKISQVRTERDAIRAQSEKMIAALDADEAGLKHLYEAEARAATAALLQGGGNRRKSIDTFFGTFAFRTVPGRYAVTDREAALPHAQALGCVRVEIAAEAYLQAAQSKLEETGELLPGVAKTEDAEAFGLSLPTKRKKGEA